MRSRFVTLSFYVIVKKMEKLIVTEEGYGEEKTLWILMFLDHKVK